MEILSGDFDLKFDLTLAPGPSPSNCLKTKLHLWSRSSTIVESMIKFIWQHNLPMEFHSTFKMPPRRMNFWCSDGTPPQTPEQTFKEVSQSGLWNILSHPTFVPIFSQIGWPPLLAPGKFLRQGHLKPYLDEILCNTYQCSASVFFVLYLV